MYIRYVPNSPQHRHVSSTLELQADSKPFSDASGIFTSQLLAGLGISWDEAPLNDLQGSEYKFSWKEGEDKETGKAVEYLKGLLGDLEVTLQNGATMRLEILDVHTKLLPTIEANNLKASGKTDALIRVCQQVVDNRGPFPWGLCITEFKTNKENLNFYQQVLELVAFAYISNYRQGAVLLGTDLNKKWQILYFDRHNHVLCQSYKFGSVAISELQKLLKSASLRLGEITKEQDAKQPLQPLQLLPVVHEEGEQDLSGFQGTQDPQADAVQALQNLARYLNDVYNQEVTLPPWVHKPEKGIPKEVPPGMYL
jgi:hypothetical protein